MKSSSKHYLLFFSLLRKYFTLLILSLDSSSVIVEPNDLHISDLLVSHYDCSEKHNVRQLSLTRVQPCTQAPFAHESTRAIADVLSALKLNASKHALVKHMSNGKVCLY